MGVTSEVLSMWYLNYDLGTVYTCEILGRAEKNYLYAFPRLVVTAVIETAEYEDG